MKRTVRNGRDDEERQLVERLRQPDGLDAVRTLIPELTKYEVDKILTNLLIKLETAEILIVQTAAMMDDIRKNTRARVEMIRMRENGIAQERIAAFFAQSVEELNSFLNDKE